MFDMEIMLTPSRTLQLTLIDGFTRVTVKPMLGSLDRRRITIINRQTNINRGANINRRTDTTTLPNINLATFRTLRRTTIEFGMEIMWT